MKNWEVDNLRIAGILLAEKVCKARLAKLSNPSMSLDESMRAEDYIDQCEDEQRNYNDIFLNHDFGSEEEQRRLNEMLSDLRNDYYITTGKRID